MLAVFSHLLFVSFPGQHDELHGFGDVRLSLSHALLPRAALLQLTLELQRDGHVQLVHLHRLAAALLQRPKHAHHGASLGTRLDLLQRNYRRM